MSNEMNLPTNLSRYYQILVEGKIPASWSDWFGGLQVHSRKEAEDMQLTTLSGLVADQAALRGILIRLWDLNLTLRSIQQVDPETISKME